MTEANTQESQGQPADESVSPEKSVETQAPAETSAAAKTETSAGDPEAASDSTVQSERTGENAPSEDALAPTKAQASDDTVPDNTASTEKTDADQVAATQKPSGAEKAEATDDPAATKKPRRAKRTNKPKANDAEKKRAPKSPPPPPPEFTNDAARHFYTRASSLITAPLVEEADLKQLRRDIDEWQASEENDAPDADKASVNNALDTATRKRHQQLANREKRLSIVVDSLEKLEVAVAEGNLKDAQSLEQKVSSRLDGLTDVADARRTELREKLAELSPKVTTLKDWRNWGTGQARDKLIESVEALVGSKLSPPQIAGEIRRARETWQGWDKTGDKPAKALWDKFDKACTAAYEPCKEFYDKQSAERAKNLETRETLCARIEKLHEETNWENPSWRDIDKAVTSVRNDWRKAGPVDRKHHKTIDKRYGAALDKLNEPLDVERKRCIKMREKLIQTVTELAEAEDLRAAMDSVREAQNAWKPTVLAHQRVERKMWKQFKTACDAVYERRKANFKARDAEFTGAKKARVAVIDQILALAKGTDEEVLGAKSQLSKLRGEYENAGELGRKDRPAVDKRFRSAIKDVEQRISAVSRAKMLEKDAHFDTLAELCIRIEALLDDGCDTSPMTAIRDEWQKLSIAD